MVDLVYWSFVVALTPILLGLAGRLISGIGAWIGLGPSRDFADAEPRGSLRPQDFHPPSGPLSWAGATPFPEVGRSRAPGRRGPSRG